MGGLRTTRLNRYWSPKLVFRDVVGKVLRRRSCGGTGLALWVRPRFPLAMCVNVHTICNEACIMCPHETLGMSSHSGTMSWPLYVKLLDEFLVKGGRILTFNNIGEVFAHPSGIEYVVEALRRRAATVYLASNALALTPRVADIILGEGFDGIAWLSCHAFCEETFRAVTGRPGFAKVRDNITYLARNHPHPGRLVVQFISDFATSDELAAARDYWESCGVAMNVIASHSFAGTSPHKESQHREAGMLEGCNGWGHDGGLPFYQVVIQPDGNVSLCCVDVAGRVSLGDASLCGIEGVWNSARFREVIEKIYSGITPSTADFICNLCPMALYSAGRAEVGRAELALTRIADMASRLLSPSAMW